jgi:hypothetical protein
MSIINSLLSTTPYNNHLPTEIDRINEAKQNNSELTNCPLGLAQRIKELQEQVFSFEKQILSQLTTASEPLHVHFRRKQREYFLERFVDDMIVISNVDLLVCGFEEEDWKWLEQKLVHSKVNIDYVLDHSSPCSFYYCAKEWVIKIIARLKDDDFLQKNKSSLCLFFRYASNALYNDFKASEEIAQALTAKDLKAFLQVFHPQMNSRILSFVIAKQPAKIHEWVHLIACENQIPHEATTIQKLDFLFKVIKKTVGIEPTVQLLFHESLSIDDQVTCFISSYRLRRKKIIQLLLKDGKTEMMAKWVEAVCSTNSNLTSFVKDGMISTFQILLFEENPALPSLLRNSLRKQELNAEMLNSILPEINMDDPEVISQKALQDLKNQFSTCNCTDRNRYHFVDNIYEDLLRKSTPADLLEKLIHDFPKETWPLLCIHFTDELHSYFSTLDDEDCIEIAAITLHEIVDNPLLQNNEEKLFDDPTKFDLLNEYVRLAIENWHQIVQKRKLFVPALEHFIEIATPEKFVLTINLLELYCYPSPERQDKKLIRILKPALKKIKKFDLNHCFQIEKKSLFSYVGIIKKLIASGSFGLQ